MFQILPLYFIISLFLGTLIYYLYFPNPQIIYKNNNINTHNCDMCHG